MDEESNQRRISPSSFFNQITKVRETADRALEFSEDNLKVIEETKTSLEGIKFAIEDLKQQVAEFDIESITNSIKDLKSEVKEINDYITVERKIAQDVQEDLRLETEDTEQKQERSQRLKEMGVPSSDGEQPQPTPAQQVGNALQDNIKQGGAVGGMLGAGLLQLVAPLLGAAMIPGSLAMGLPKLGGLGFQKLFKGDKGDKGDSNFITRFFDRSEKSEKDLKEDIKSEIKDELNLTTVREGGKVVGGNATQEESDLMKREQELEMLIDAEYETGGKIDYDKIAKLEKELEETENKLYKLSGFNQDSVNQDSVQPEKKDNRVMNFIKKGGVAGFLGRKLFGKKDKENKAQEVGATNPEGEGDKDTSYSESFSYKGRLDPATLEFIPDEGSLPPGVPLEKAQQDVYKSKIEMLEFEFNSDVMQGMTKEEALQKYGPQSNLYRFKENYNNTLEYGGYELDVEKHYDSVKNSMFGKKKRKGQDSSLKGEKRDIKGVIGGVADSLTGGFFNFDKRGNTKAQDFAQGTADTLTGGIFDFDKKGSTKLQRFGQGFADAITGNLTDFDRKGGKTVGPTRAVTGIADFFTANMFDLDKRGEFNFFGKGKKKKGESPKPEIESYSREQELDTNFDLNTGRAYVNGVEVDPQAYAEFKSLSEKEQLNQAGAFVIENAIQKEKSIKPIIESDNKNLQSNVFQPMNNNPIIVVENNANQEASGTGNEAVRVPANQPNTQDSGELVMTDDPSSFLKTIKNEQLNIASSNVLPHQVAQNLK